MFKTMLHLGKVIKRTYANFFFVNDEVSVSENVVIIAVFKE